MVVLMMRKLWLCLCFKYLMCERRMFVLLMRLWLGLRRILRLSGWSSGRRVVL